MLLQRAAYDVLISAPNRFGDLLAAEKLSGTGKEQPGDCEFTRGELDRLALQTDGMVALAQGIAAHFEQRIDTLRLPRVQQHICAHIKLVRTHRVKYHIIRTRAEAFFQGIWIQKLPDHNDWRAAIRIAFTPDTHRVARCEMTMCGVNDNQVEQLTGKFPNQSLIFNKALAISIFTGECITYLFEQIRIFCQHSNFHHPLLALSFRSTQSSSTWRS